MEDQLTVAVIAEVYVQPAAGGEGTTAEAAAAAPPPEGGEANGGEPKGGSKARGWGEAKSEGTPK